MHLFKNVKLRLEREDALRSTKCFQKQYLTGMTTYVLLGCLWVATVHGFSHATWQGDPVVGYVPGSVIVPILQKRQLSSMEVSLSSVTRLQCVGRGAKAEPAASVHGWFVSSLCDSGRGCPVLGPWSWSDLLYFIDTDTDLWQEGDHLDRRHTGFRSPGKLQNA